MMGCGQARIAVETAPARELLGDDAALHLSGCAPCNRYAKETFGLTELLAAQPRVEAPADFDFRLRARLARERAENQTTALRGFWTRTFSIPQTATALALIMFAAGAAALYLRPGAVTAPQPIAAVQNTQTPVETAVQQMEPPPAAETGISKPVRISSGSGRMMRPAPVSPREPLAANDEMLAGAQEVLIYRPGATRSVVVPRRGQVIWGAQLVGMQRASAPAAVETF